MLKDGTLQKRSLLLVERFCHPFFLGEHLESEEKNHRIGFLKLIKLEVSLQPFIKYVGCKYMICCITLGLTKRENLFKAQALDRYMGLQHLCGEKREDQHIIGFLVDDCHLCIHACICIHKRVSTSFTSGFPNVRQPKKSPTFQAPPVSMSLENMVDKASGW